MRERALVVESTRPIHIEKTWAIYVSGKASFLVVIFPVASALVRAVVAFSVVPTVSFVFVSSCRLNLVTFVVFERTIVVVTIQFN